MLFEPDLVVMWVALAVTLVVGLAVASRRRPRFIIVSSIPFLVVVLAVAAVLPGAIALPAILVGAVAFALARNRWLNLRTFAEDPRVLDVRPSVPTAVSPLTDLEPLGFQELGALQSGGPMTHVILVFCNPAQRTFAQVMWWPELPKYPARLVFVSDLEAGGRLATVGRVQLPPAPGVFAQGLPKRRPPQLLAAHLEAAAFVRAHTLDLAPADPTRWVPWSVALHRSTGAWFRQRSWRLTIDLTLRLLFRRPAANGPLWERPEVPAQLDAWAAGIHERLADLQVQAEADRELG